METLCRQEATTNDAADENDVNQIQQGVSKKQFACLYTKHKTQKRKVWNDGRLVLRFRGAVLHDANPTPGSSDSSLDQCELSNAQIHVLLQSNEMRLESEKFLIEVTGIWRNPAFASTGQAAAPKACSAMQKVLSRKFQRPRTYIPPPPVSRQNSFHPVLGKRKQPLQPGELVRMHHGRGDSLQDSTMGRGTSVRSPTYRRFGGLSQRDASMVLQGDQGLSNKLNCTFPNNNLARPEGWTEQSNDTQLENSSRNATAQVTNRGKGQPDALHSPDIRVAFDSANRTGQDQDHRPSTFALQPMDTTANLNYTLRKEQGREQERGSKKKEFNFVSNEFNASSFYGLDEEEEDEQAFFRGSSTGQSDSTSTKFNATSKFTKSFNNAVGIDPSEEQNNPSTRAFESGQIASSKVSDTALLALFGAASPAATQMPGDRASPTTDTSNLQNSDAKQSLDQTDNAHTETLSSKTIFFLPSQSSSEEESCNNGS